MDGEKIAVSPYVASKMSANDLLVSERVLGVDHSHEGKEFALGNVRDGDVPDVRDLTAMPQRHAPESLSLSAWLLLCHCSASRIVPATAASHRLQLSSAR